MAIKPSTFRLVVCISAFTLTIGFASVGNSADNLDQLLGVALPAPRPNPPALRPAPTPAQDETARPSRGDLKSLQASGNNQFNPNPPPHHP